MVFVKLISYKYQGKRKKEERGKNNNRNWNNRVSSIHRLNIYRCSIQIVFSRGLGSFVSLVLRAAEK